MIIQTVCQWCNTEHDLSVTRKGYKDWMNGAFVQVAFPELSADDRELLISGTCGICWDDMFGDFDE